MRIRTDANIWAYNCNRSTLGQWHKRGLYLICLQYLALYQMCFVSMMVYKDDTQHLITDSTNAETLLGPAQDSANILSRFTFFWVNSLIDKGVAGNLHQIDDLYQLPASIQVIAMAQRMRVALAETSSMFWALHKAHGVEFYLNGILRFVADLTEFAGPLLLGGLLSHTTANGEDGTTTFDPAPYWYAIGLFAMTLICEYIFTTHRH